MQRIYERVNEACEFQKIGVKKGQNSENRTIFFIFRIKITNLENREIT